VKLLDDSEVGEYILNKIAIGHEDDIEFLIIKLTDKAALEVGLSICQLYIDNQ
jgi:hypothetical protein